MNTRRPRQDTTQNAPGPRVLGTAPGGARVLAKVMKNGRLYVWQEWTSGGKTYKRCLGTYGNTGRALGHPLVRAALGIRAISGPK